MSLSSKDKQIIVDIRQLFYKLLYIKYISIEHCL